jgi:ABC-type transport system involved in multi-copper enzyme maturation permease subunit
MKLREIFRYEIRHRLRSASTWIYAVVFLLIGFAMIHIDADGNSVTHVNAPSRLALLAIMAGMVGLLVSAAFFGDAAIRDYDAGMDPLLFTAPIRKIDYIGGRFLGALTFNALILLGIPVGQAIATLMPYLPRDVFGPFVGSAFVQTYFLFLLPNLILSGVVLFTVAILTRQTVPVYLAAILVFIGYVVAVNLPSTNAVVDTLTDPLGVRVLNAVTERWTPVERNDRLLGSSGALLMNRVVWLTIALCILAVLLRRFRFEHATRVGGLSRVFRGRPDRSEGLVSRGLEISRPAVTTSAKSISLATPAIMTRTFGVRTSFRQIVAITRRGIAEIAASPVFALLFLAKVGLTLIMGWDAGEAVFDTSTTPLTILVIERLSDTPLVPVTYLLVALFAGELIWKNRDNDMAEIADAAPVSEGATLVGNFLALVFILAALQLPVLIGGVLLQAFQGYTNFEIGLYLRLLFGIQLPNLVLVAALAVLIHVAVNQKYAGHLAVVVVMIALAIVRGVGWVEHHLLVYGTDPGWTYSTMNGFGPFVRPFVWFKVYWSAWAAMLLVGATLLSVRGRETGVRARLSLARARFAGPIARAAAVAAALILTTGGFVFYNTNIINEYRSGDARGVPAADYEKRYRRYLDIPQPTIVGASLRVELFPERAGAELGGSFRLRNQSGVSIDSVHVLVNRDMQVRSMSVHGGSPVLADSVAGYRIFALDRPLAPGDSVDLAFNLTLARRGFTNDRASTEIVSNGTWIDRRFLPLIGYQPVFELQASDQRARLGLPPRPPMASAKNPGLDRNRQSIRNEGDLVRVHAVIGTSSDQVAVTPGLLRRSWKENGRSYFEYEMRPPNSADGGLFSARYASSDDRWRDIALRVLHHPREGDNVERMMHGMKASLEYYTSHFGPYPDSLLQVIEIPRYSVFGIALPLSMAFSEDAFHSRVRAGEIDQPFYGTAHETAHHWWGGMVQSAPVRGHGLLTESLANYSAMMVMEKTFGREVAQRVYKFQMDRYFSGHGEYSREAPLIDVGEQPYLTYRKGAVAMYTMRDQIGEAAVNTALRRYVEKFSRKGPPYPTSLDLIAELRAVTPDSLQSLVTDLFETVTLWEVKADRASVERTADGKYQVTLDVQARKLRADSLGREVEISMNDLVEIGVFAAGKDGKLGEPLYLERQRVHSGKQTIRVVVDQEPKRAGVDPYDKVIDRERGDNMRALKLSEKEM